MTGRDGFGGKVRLGDLLRVLRDAVARNVGPKLVSVLVAFGLWFFVNAGERDSEAALQVALELRNIPPSLMVVSPRIEFIDLRVSGPRTLLSRIDPGRLAVPLDLRGVRAGPAVFRILADTLDLPRGVTVVRLTPSEITLEFARVHRSSVPVRLAFSGKPPGDLRVTDTKVAPEVVEVIGPADEVEQIKAVETLPIDLSEAKAGLIERDVALDTTREYLSFSATLVRAQVRLEEPEIDRVLKKVTVVVRNSPHRTILRPEAVEIAVRGPRSVIESLELGHGAVYVDASDHGPGRYEVEPQVDMPVDVELIGRKPPTVNLEVLGEKRRGNGG
jgi:hypothetical protein